MALGSTSIEVNDSSYNIADEKSDAGNSPYYSTTHLEKYLMVIC